MRILKISVAAPHDGHAFFLPEIFRAYTLIVNSSSRLDREALVARKEEK